jgi:AcrR family transcriptional regulator
MPSHQLEAQPSSSRDRLLEAAKRLFASQGYEQSATSAIARKAGTSESQLIRYFGGKMGLLDALLDEAWTTLNARVARAISKRADHREALIDGLQTFAATLSRDRDLATLFVFEGRRLRGDGPHIRHAPGLLLFTKTIRELVRQAQADGAIDSTLDPTAVTTAMLGATEAMIRDRLLAKRSATRAFGPDEIGRTLQGMLHGFRPDPAARRPAKR